MKTLILVRHAKSSWDNPDLTDIERPLNQRGLHDAPFMAELIGKNNVKPDLILSSSAVRALTTAKFFAKELNYPEESINVRDLIYDRGPRQIIDMLGELDDSLNCVMLFGHNPDLTAMSNYLTGNDFGNVPTCGAVCIDFNTTSWSNIGDDVGKTRFFEYPKKYYKKNG